MKSMLNTLKSIPRDLSLSAVIIGFVTVMVGYLSTVTIIYQAAEVSGASTAQINSWIGALGIGMGLTTIGLTLFFRSPVVTAWSTPGAALLVTSAVGFSLQEVIGAFIVSACLMVLCGVTGWFERVMDRVPASIAGAMLAGVLLQFGMNVFLSMEGALVLSLAMFISYLLTRRFLPRHAIVLALLTGLIVSLAQGFRFDSVELLVTQPVAVMPHFSWQSVVSVAIPLFTVTMASQNIPGVATMRAAGYETSVSPIITTTGVASLLLAPFGCLGLNLAAITAAFCMSSDAHEDRDKRYVAAFFAGMFYLLLGVFGATVGVFLSSLPAAIVLVIAGLALFSPIAGSLASSMEDPVQREPAIITFLVTVSGVTLFGIGSAFWGLVAGITALAVVNLKLSR